MVFGLNAWFLATLVAGALWWVAAADAPSWRKLPGAAGARAYVSAWSRGGPVLALLALISAGLGVAAAVSDDDPLWAVGAALMLACIAHTVLFMGGVGHQLRDAAAEREAADEAGVSALLRRWSHLHLIRCGLASAAVIIFIVAAH